MSDYSYAFTVFTATYNRAHTLHRVYESLKRQTFPDFEWLVVDDGSVDGTAELIRSWQTQSRFPIHYRWQENRGKHIAFNLGVKHANGELFLTLDSDDWCVPEALERFRFHWTAIPEEVRSKYSAVTALCVNDRGEVIGDRFPQDILDSNSLEVFYRHKVRGEKWGFHRTEVLREFPFPEINGRFVPEDLVWSRIAISYRTRFINESLRVYCSNDSSYSDQLTKEREPLRHAHGLSLWHQSILNNEIAWLGFAPEHFLRSAIHYVRFSSHTGKTSSNQFRELKNLFAKALWLLAWPFGRLIHYMECRSRSNMSKIGQDQTRGSY